MRKVFLFSILISVFLISGCTPRISITPVGSETYEPLPDNTNVTIYSKESDINKQFVTIGIINYSNPGKYQVLTLGDAIPELKSTACSLGANGIIIDESYPIKSGIISTGIGVRARAVKVQEK